MGEPDNASLPCLTAEKERGIRRLKNVPSLSSVFQNYHIVSQPQKLEREGVMMGEVLCTTSVSASHPSTEKPGPRKMTTFFFGVNT
jgi:hypothetical protein